MEKKLLQFSNNRGLLVFIGKKKTKYCLRKNMLHSRNNNIEYTIMKSF